MTGIPWEQRPETAESRTCLRRPMMAMEAPWSPNWVDISNPIPDPPPVRRATFPFSTSALNGDSIEAARHHPFSLFLYFFLFCIHPPMPKLLKLKATGQTQVGPTPHKYQTFQEKSHVPKKKIYLFLFLIFLITKPTIIRKLKFILILIFFLYINTIHLNFHGISFLL